MSAPEPLAAIAVVVPAHDEAELLPRCIEHLAAAIEHTRRARPRLVVAATIALDRCRDASAAIVADAISRGVGGPGSLRAVAVDAGGPGRARALGVAAALADPRLERLARDEPSRVWLANTDADSAVPASWLEAHAEAADGGADVLVGRVTPDPADLDARVLAAWRDRHRVADGRAHVFGADLGVRLAAYRRVGGFADVAVGEDRLLVEAARDAGLTIEGGRGAPVLTSGRTQSRVAEGFAGYLGDLATEVRP